jgi:hypothetical protein
MEFGMPQDHISQDHAAEAMSRFHRVFAAAMDNNRVLFEDLTTQWRDESMRFFDLRLDRTRQVMENLGECRGLPGLLAVQQGWMSDMMQDFTAQGLRYSEILSQNLNRVQEEGERQAEEVAEAAQPEVQEAQEMAQPSENLAEDLPPSPQEDQSYDQNFGQPQIH